MCLIKLIICFKKLKEYYDDQDILKKSKTSISVNDIEETYSVEDVFEV